MYHVSAQGVDERMITVHYYYYVQLVGCEYLLRNNIECHGELPSTPT